MLKHFFQQDRGTVALQGGPDINFDDAVMKQLFNLIAADRRCTVENQLRAN